MMKNEEKKGIQFCGEDEMMMTRQNEKKREETNKQRREISFRLTKSDLFNGEFVKEFLELTTLFDEGILLELE